MRAYSIHLRRHGLDPDRDIAVVKEGFSWPAFFLGFLWALWHRLWLAAAGIFLAHVALSVLAYLLSPDPLTQTAAAVGLAAIIGFIANDLRRRKLARQGFALTDVVIGEDRDAALRRFLDATPALAAELDR